jgi:inhibitor of KinA
MLSLVPLGDQAALAYFTREDEAWQFANRIRLAGEPWLVDVVQAYASVAVFYDLDRIRFAAVAERLQSLAHEAQAVEIPAPRLHEIPCCYEMGLDLARIAEHTGLNRDEVIRRHAEPTYTVYAIGFCPGFPYLGYLPEMLSGVPRLPSPRLRVEAGSVGLTGRQTGIYTEPRPGGWNLVGRTPLVLVDVADNYFPLQTGDRVRFVRIDEREFAALQGTRI